MINSLISPLSSSLIESLSFIGGSGLPVFHAPLLIDDRVIPSIIPSVYTGSLSRYVTKWDGDLKFFSRSSVPLAPKHGTDFDTDTGGDIYIEAPVDYSNQMKGYSPESERTNLVLNSEPTAIENASSAVTYESFSWGFGSFTNCVRYPSGNVTKYHYAGSTDLGVQYTISAYVVMDDGSKPVIGTGASDDLRFVLRGATPAIVNQNIEKVFGNIYRVCITAVAGGAAATSNGFFQSSTQSGKAFRIVGLDIEASGYASSYIKTTGGISTRIRDRLAYDISGKNILEKSNFSLSFFIDLYTDDTTTFMLYGFSFQLIRRSSGDILIQWSVTEGFSFSTMLTKNNFVHLGITAKSGEQKLFIDGIHVDSDSASLTNQTRTSLVVGSHTTSNESNVKNIKDVKIWNRTLSDAEMEYNTAPKFGAGFGAGFFK